MNRSTLFPTDLVLVRIFLVLAGIFLASILLSACGENDDRKYLVNGDFKTCTVIDTQPCGNTLACKDSGIYQCHSN